MPEAIPIKSHKKKILVKDDIGGRAKVDGKSPQFLNSTQRTIDNSRKLGTGEMLPREDHTNCLSGVK